MSIVLEAQVSALLARLDAQRERQCRDLVAQAHAEAQQMLRDARHRGRAQLREAVLAKRARVAERCRRERLDLDGAARQREFVCLRLDLDAGLAGLPAALQSRWRDASAQLAWCESLLTEAARLMGGGGWRVEHAPGLNAAALAALAERVRALGGADCTLVEDPTIGAGLRVRRGGTCLDGTPAGLMSDRARLEAALLDELAQAGDAA